MTRAVDEDTRLSRRSMARRLQAPDPRKTPQPVTDLAANVQSPSPEDADRLAKEFELERAARAERIRRGMERAAQPAVPKPVTPIDLDDKDL